MGASLEPERDLSTVELLRRAVEETRMLARAELLHARVELKEELRSALLGAALFGAAAALVICALSVFFVAIAIDLPMGESAGCFLVGCVLVVLAALAGGVGFARLPKHPLEHTRRSLREDLAVLKERTA